MVTDLGAIEEGSDLAEYDTPYSVLRAGGTTLGLGLMGVTLLGGVAMAGYNHLKNKRSKRN